MSSSLSIKSSVNNWFLMGLPLFYWFIFKPSNWGEFVELLNRDMAETRLKNNFCLTDLSRSHFSERKLLGIIFQLILLPLYSAFGLWLITAKGDLDSTQVSFVLGASIGFGISAAITLSITVSIVAGIIAALLFPIAGWLIFSSTITVWNTAVLSFILGMIAHVLISLPDQYSPLTESLGELFIGIFVGLFGIFILFGIPLESIDRSNSQIIPIALLATLVSLVISVSNYMCCSRKTPWILVTFISFWFVITCTLLFGSDGARGGGSKGVLYAAAISASLAIPHTIIHVLRGEKEKFSIVGFIAAILAFSLVLGIISVSYENFELLASGNISSSDYEKTDPDWSLISFTLLTAVLGLTFSWWRSALFYPIAVVWNSLVYALSRFTTKSLLRYHAAFWDECQWIPFSDLPRYLLWEMRRNPLHTTAALFMLEKNRRQAWAVQEVKLQIDLQLIETLAIADIQALAKAHETLSSHIATSTSWLREFEHISTAIDIALKSLSVQDKIIGLGSIRQHLEALITSIEHQHNSTIRKLLVFSSKWHKLIYEELEALQTERKRLQENFITSPYVIVMPLRNEHSSFVGRTELVERLENILFTQNSPVFLHGQYRIGKTSFLYNISKLLHNPKSIASVFIDLQGCVIIGGNITGFFSEFATQIQIGIQKNLSLSLPDFEPKQKDVYREFNLWLDKVQKLIQNKTLMLMLDEFGVLDEIAHQPGSSYEQARLDGMLRVWIQHRENFLVVITSQRLTEFKRWPHLSNNMLPVHIGYLTEAEAVQLIEKPVVNFPLQYQPEATQRIITLTRRHPALIQLLCGEIVRLKNSQPEDVRFLVSEQDVTQSVPAALAHGSSIFGTFENKLSEQGRRVACYLASVGSVTQEALQTEFPEQLAEALALLLQLELIESDEHGYRFQVDLFKQYFSLH